MRVVSIWVAVVVASAVVLAGTPAEDRARADAIKATAAAIQAEVDQAAKGDWAQWHEQMAAYRANLNPRIEAGMANVAAWRKEQTGPSPLLKVPGTPPMFEMPSYGMYVVAPNTGNPVWLQDLAAPKAMIAVSQWLRKRNIDLLVVPAPRLAEVYGDMLAPAPKTTTVAPWLRKVALNLLRSGVEVVDLMPLFQKARADGGENLYLPADGHWSDRAQQIAATEIGRRLKRYDVVKAALKLPAKFSTNAEHAGFAGAVFDMLTPAEQAEVQASVNDMPLTVVRTTAGVQFEEPADSPVVVIGDSFTHYFQLAIRKGSGIDALLSKEINIPVSNVSTAGGTLDPIKEFVRRPELLAKRRVVVWILNNSLFAYPADAWTLPPLPVK